MSLYIGFRRRVDGGFVLMRKESEGVSRPSAEFRHGGLCAYLPVSSGRDAFRLVPKQLVICLDQRNPGCWDSHARVRVNVPV